MRNLLRAISLLLILSFFAFKPVLAQNCQAVITPTGATTFCFGDSVKLSAGNGQKFLWSTGETTASIYAKSSGNYSVTVTDLTNCQSTSAPIAVMAINAPDAALADSVDNFTNCSYILSSANFNLTVANISQTKATNTKYVIDWGDGNASIFGNAFTKASHTYLLPGSFQLKFTVTNPAGCSATKNYLVFNGSNPSFGVASQGNTNDCAPATFTFDIINTQNNTPSTVYTFQFDDGTPALHFTHTNLPKTITHTFTKGAYGKPGNAFTLTAFATNPCGTTPATVGGIRISATPKADFKVNPDSIACVNFPVQLSDFSDGGFNANASGTATGNYNREWKILPATGWAFTNGTNNTSAQPILVFSQAGSYQIKLIVSPRGGSAKCRADSLSKTIIIRDLPKAAFTITKPASNCAPAQVTLQNQFVSAEITYNWDILPKQGWSFLANSDSVSVNPQVNFSAPGNYHIKLTARNICGQIQLADSLITIQGTPEVSLPGTKSYCRNQTVAFSSSNPDHVPTYKSGSAIVNYDWKVIGSGYQFVNGTSAGSQFPEIFFSNAGTYQVILRAANACGFSVPDTQTIVIAPAPQIIIRSSVAAICAGQGSAVLTATGAATYKWFPATGLSGVSGNVITANPAATTTYNIIGTNASGCSDTVQFTVVVKPAIPLTVSASSSAICVGQQTTTLTASGANIYNWSPALGLSATSGATVIANPLVSTTYTVTATDTVAGCTATKTIRIEVLPKPAVTAGADTIICASPQGLQLKGFPAGGNWSGQSISNSGFFVGSSVGQYSVIYTYTNGNGCSASASKKITVVALPQVSAGNDTTFCAANATVLLKGFPAGGIWSGSNLVTSAGNFTANTPGIYHLTYTFGNGNCQVSSVKTITINALPPTVIIPNQHICPGTTAVLTATGNATRYEWYDALTGGNLLYTGNTFTTPALQTSKTYFVIAYNAAGCASSSRTSVQVIVNPIVLTPTVADVTLCGSGSQTVLNASGSTGTYAWYDAPQNGTLLFTGNQFQTPVLNATTNYYAQAISAEGCVSFSRAKVTVFVLPALANNSLSGNQQICANETPAPITGSVPTGGNGNYNYSWESSTDNISFSTVSASANTIYFSPNALNQTTWFRRKITSGPCADYSLAIKIIVVQRPVAPAAVNQTICNNGTAMLNATYSGSQINWFATATGGQPIFTGNSYTTPALQNTTEYFAEAINVQGCASISRSRFLVTVLPALSNNFISVDQTICAGETPVMLNGSAPAGGNGTYSYAWESSLDNQNFAPATGVNNAATYNPTALNQTMWFRRIITSGPCQNSISGSVKITVIPIIANNQLTVQPQIICAGNLPQILTATQPTGGTGNYTYLWQMSTSGSTNGFVPAANINQNQNYTPGVLMQNTWFRRVVYSGNCSQVSAAYKIEVNPPLAGNIIAASQTIYAGTTPALLNGSQPTGGNNTYTYTWESSATGNNAGFTTVTSAASGINFQPVVINQTTWFRRVVQSGDCAEISNVVQILVVPAVTNNVILQDQTICESNMPDMLQGTQPVGGIGNYTFLWEISTVSATSGFSTALGAANQNTYQPAALNQTTWFRRTVFSGSYSLTSNAVQVTVNPNIGNNTISMAQTICAGSTPALLIGSAPTNGSGTYTYLWEISTSGTLNSFVNASGVNNKADYEPGMLQQTTWFRRKVSAGHCFDNVSAAVQITVNQVPAPPALAPQLICPGTAATFIFPQTGQRDATTEYEWYETAIGGQLINKGTSFTTPNLTANKTYYVQKVQQGCSSARVAVEVNVRENTADAGEDVSIISGKSATLRAKGGVSYKWFPAEGLSNANIANPIATPAKTTVYTLEVVSEAGCVSSDEITVTVLPKIKIVNTFTPNNDGVNDTWEIKGLEEYKNCHVDIFNRWGAKVYASVGYPQPWNGLSLSGEELPVATYYYIIYLNQTEAPLSGSVTIIR